MRRHLCTQLLPRLRTRGCTPQLLAPYTSFRASLRFQSSDAPSRTAQDADDLKSRFVAIERVGGRECHISWSEEAGSSGVRKEWRDIAAVDPEDGKIAAPTNSLTGRISSWFGQMVLPTNYPHSVHRSYLPFHILQFFETTVATITSVLCNQALLTSVGVSAEGSVFGAVAVQWIIKDGAGEVAKLFFIRRFSPYFDSHPKTFTFFGELMGCLGSGLQIATLLIAPSPGNFLLCAAGGNIFKIVGNAIWFTTHIKFMRYFSEQGNTGDVAAKDESQSSIAQLVGYASGISLLAVSHTAPYLYAIFAFAVPVHLAMTAYMMRVATFELLTLPRVSCLAQEYVTRGQVSSLGELDAAHRTGLFGEFYRDKSDRWLTLAPRVGDVLDSGTELERVRWQICAGVFEDDRYLLFPRGRNISVFFHPDAANDDMLCAIYHAALVRDALINREASSTDVPPAEGLLEPTDTDSQAALKLILADTGARAERDFEVFREALEAREWRTDELCYADHGHRVTWAHDG
ncbi:DUF647-domain-containing protein [Trametes versicolor FP-101664 SS1]|uniref:DUF647-domain-containing protein n=1 Tax=Trametes versicolor (strain FP-101664) TaxID=717944 RepID=UPI00046238B5|nr:DUF647-domain-containing protein [Trametes versicolor FP-101664 SS1]EIW57290.1 DUF647-domain-containing protein [Trametes versicolor FP-101664 SS1]